MADKKEKFRTNLTKEELNHFKEKLEEEKKNVQDEIENLKNSAESIDKNADDRQSAAHHHIGDVSAENQMKKTTYTLLEKQRDKLKLIDAAFERIKVGTYGLCTATGKPIQKERLDVMPYAMHSVEAKKGNQ